MARALLVVWILSIAACISSPDVTLVDETRAAPVSRDGSAESIALVEDLGLDAGDASVDVVDGGVSPHPETDAEPEDAGSSKGRPPKKKKP